MKKWLAVALFVCVAGAVQAAEGEGKKKGQDKGKGGDVTKEQFIAQAKKQAETKGGAFDQAKAEEKFSKMDKNQDGVLSGDEKPQGGKKDKKEKKEKKSADGE